MRGGTVQQIRTDAEAHGPQTDTNACACHTSSNTLQTRLSLWCTGALCHAHNRPWKGCQTPPCTSQYQGMQCPRIFLAQLQGLRKLLGSIPIEEVIDAHVSRRDNTYFTICECCAIKEGQDRKRYQQGHIHIGELTVRTPSQPSLAALSWSDRGFRYIVLSCTAWESQAVTSPRQTRLIKYGINSGQLQTCQLRLWTKAFRPHLML